ncbi:phosphoglycerate dehydrogenase [Conexibacter arvalis]|uniref:D-3-phosphoglycerate dehydrogenase n=1 Tax=Conexibacter arvalis TaxID=912552 RepID=A0A840IHJ0_9ACTN|nr:phosphoglycerate dehydrogenase [Conexibacter arvalis]MBB4663691.1 D-3-phosphoglycerate dehydrogenase [Conexibacter arvalis]
MSERLKILVKEKLADSGVQLLREHFDVDLGDSWSDDEFRARIGDYHGILIRSATKMTEEYIALGSNLRVIGRAGVGVNNVDVPAATRRGIIVANAPQSNVVTAAEHTLALLLSLARNVPQADASLKGGKWERSKFGGVEVYEKTLGVIGFGRIGQLVAERAKGFGMKVVAYDPFVASDRYRDLGVEKAETIADAVGDADFITVHLPVTPETRGSLDADFFAHVKEGARLINCARGELVDDAALKAALDSGKLSGAALDVFPSEPITDYPLFDGYPNVVVTPHLGASTAEAQDRAGVQTAEQVIAALTGGTVTTAVNIPAIAAEDMEVLGPFVPLCQQLGKLAVSLADGSIDALELEFFGRIGERDTRLLSIAVLQGVLSGHTEEEVNQVNAPSIAEERGIEVTETKRATARDFTDLVRVTVVSGDTRQRVVGTNVGRRNRPHLLEVWGQRFDLQLERDLALFRYEDVPGMIGRVGSIFGEKGINIVSAAVGRTPGDDDGPARDGNAVMVVTTDAPVPAEVVGEIVAGAGFLDGRAVTL